MIQIKNKLSIENYEGKIRWVISSHWVYSLFHHFRSAPQLILHTQLALKNFRRYKQYSIDMMVYCPNIQSVDNTLLDLRNYSCNAQPPSKIVNICWITCYSEWNWGTGIVVVYLSEFSHLWIFSDDILKKLRYEVNRFYTRCLQSLNYWR